MKQKIYTLKKIHYSISLILTLFFASFTANSQVTNLRFGTDFLNNTVNSYTFSSNDKVHTVDAAAFFATSTSDVCSGAGRRTQVNSIILELVSTSASTIVVHGGSSGTSTRTILSVETADTRNGTYSLIVDPANPGSALSSTITSTACGTMTVTGLNIPVGKFVKLSFATTVSPSSSLQNVRVSGFDITAAPLPVKYGAMNAIANNGAVRLTWDVVSEVNTDKYYIERSTNGTNFEIVGALNATNANRYTFVDNSVANIKTGFYRIRAVDKDGTISLSNIIRVNLTKTAAGALVSPNPVVNGVINVQLTDIEKSNYTFNVFDITGKRIFTKSVNVEAGSSTQSLELGTAAQKGVYQLVITNTQGLQINKRVVVQ